MNNNFDFTNLNSEFDIYNNFSKLDFYDLDISIIIANKHLHILIRYIIDSNYCYINKKNLLNNNLNCFIDFKKNINCSIFNLLKNFNNIKYDFINNNTSIIYSNYNALELLSTVYDNSDARCRNTNKYNLYLEWINSCNIIPNCYFVLNSIDSIIPYKNNINDIGYYLTIIKKIKDLSINTSLYDTGLIIIPQFGYYIKLISTINYGYILNNFTSNNDQNVKETLKISLTKIDNSIPDITLPFKCAQLLIVPYFHFKVTEKNNT